MFRDFDLNVPKIQSQGSENPISRFRIFDPTFRRFDLKVPKSKSRAPGSALRLIGGVPRRDLREADPQASSGAYQKTPLQQSCGRVCGDWGMSGVLGRVDVVSRCVAKQGAWRGYA